MERYVQMIVSAVTEQKLLENGEPVINITNPFLVINPVVFPTLYSFVITILLTGIDLTGSEIIEVRVTSPSNKTVFSTGKSNSPSMPLGSNITLSLDLKNIKLEEEGKYILEFRLDDEVISSSNFFVKYFEHESV